MILTIDEKLRLRNATQRIFNLHCNKAIAYIGLPFSTLDQNPSVKD